MLWFEREVVGPSPNPRTSPSDHQSKPSSTARCATCPSTCAGVAGESVLLGSYVLALRRTGRLAEGDAQALAAQLESWESSRIGVLRQYVRMMKSLVSFAENELAPAGAA